ncbi:MAG TPA: ABC transporter ATP-binding protein [Casimicrobiaceae bacterium]|jgi:spermidine/putrescine ABC transporter ATP-binding subunit|nr:ABC transporter ATP-binding protein [Casimicrobiaceae bacterium]
MHTGMDASNASADVQLVRVRKRFGAVTAVDDVSLDIGRGSIFSLLGPSGCGKTTTLRLIAGFEQPDAGDVFIRGARVTAIPPYRRDFSMVFQSYALFPHLTVAENVAFGLRMRRVARSDRARSVAEALDLVKLGTLADRHPRQLSGGQQQRVALARAIVVKPAVLLLDEPLGALDKMLREEMQVELRSLQQRLGITAVFVTHDQEEALTLSDRVAVMRNGVIEQIGAPREIYDRPRSAFVASFLGASNFVAGTVVAREAVAIVVETPAGRVVALGDRPIADKVRIAVRPERLRMERGGVEGLPARIRDIVYRGPVTHFYLESAAGSLIAYRQDARAGDFGIGEAVHCTWDPDSAVVLDEAQA